DADRYPSVTGRYGRSVFLHLTGAGTTTQAGLYYGGDRWLVGATYGTPQSYDDLSSISAELSRALLRPTRLVNLQLVRRLDEDSAVGFSLNPAFGYTRSFPVGGVITNSLSLELEAIASYIPSAALRDRTILRGVFGPTGDLGFYGELARRDESFTQLEPFTSRAALARYVFLAGVGPRLHPVEWVTLAGSLELNYELLTGAVDDDGLSFSRTTFPALQLGAE